MFGKTRQILEMIRFSHTVFAMPFALLAAVMAWTTPTSSGEPPAFRAQDLLGILVCLVAARSAAMAFNRIADRKHDAQNPRTENRHLPQGSLSLASVAAFTLFSSLAFLAGTLLFLPNRLPLLLAVPVLLVLLGYSFAKRFTSLVHFWLGAALMLSPVSAWIAIRGGEVLAAPLDLAPALFLGVGVLLWVAGFDIIYACQDAAYDVGAKLRSIPALWGVAGALKIAAACHVGMLLTLALLPLACPSVGFGAIYGVGLALVGGLLAYEHALVSPDDLTRVNAAFFQVNAVVSFGLFVVGSLDLLL